MDYQKLSEAIVSEVLHHLPFQSWWAALLLEIIATVAAAGIGTYIGALLKIKGANLATRLDFDTLKQQLSDNTKLVETIKADVAQKDWVMREWQSTRRQKLEQLLEKRHECDAFLDKLSDLKKGRIPHPDPSHQLHTLVTLYLPELANETDAYYKKFHEYIEIHRAYLTKPWGATIKEDDFKELFRSSRTHLHEEGVKLEEAAARLLRVIMSVPSNQI